MKIVQWSLPQRCDYIKQLRESGTSDYQHQLHFQGRVQTFPVFTVPIELPCYRLSNGRTRSAQKEVIATKGLRSDFFTADPDSEPALKEQHEILMKMASQAGLLNILKRHEQDRPLILTNDGYIVNGNRRVCIILMLLEEDESAYFHFKRVQVICLPVCTERDIKELEGRLQVLPEGKAEYSWVDEAMLYRELREQQWSDEQTAGLYEKKVPEMRELIAMLEDAEQYLESRGKVGQYSLVLKKEYGFRQLQKMRKKCGDDEPKKQLFSSVAYLMLDDPDTAEGRLYEGIPDAYKYLDNIAQSVQEDFKAEIPKSEDQEDDLGILGGSADNPYIGLVQVLRTRENKDKARDVIRDALEEMRSRERERRDATFCIRQVQQAYTKLQSALSALDENAETSGLEDTLHNIEEIVSDIRNYLSNVVSTD